MNDFFKENGEKFIDLHRDRIHTDNTLIPRISINELFEAFRGARMCRVQFGQLVVHYNQNMHIDRELDEDIEKVLKKHGYSRDGSGVQLEGQNAGVRDISFRKEIDETKAISDNNSLYSLGDSCYLRLLLGP